MDVVSSHSETAGLSRATATTLLGQAIAAGGLVIQWAAKPETFAAFGFPPGLIYLIGTSVIIWLNRRSRWAPAAGVTMGLWILTGGLVGGDLQANLATGDTGVITGNLVMTFGLALSAVAGVIAIVLNRRAQPDHHEIRPVSRQHPRRLAAIIAVGGLIADALGDGAPEGLHSDGLGPLLFLALAVTVALVPGRTMLMLTSLICFAFLGGGLSSPEFVSRLATPSEPLPFGGALTQVLGLLTAMIAAAFAALPPSGRGTTAPSRPVAPACQNGGTLNPTETG